MELSKHFILFSNCIPVKGISRSTICDLQKGFYVIISNELYEFIQLLHKYTILEIINQNLYPKKKVQDFIDYLNNNKFGHFTSEPALFPQIDTKFRSSSVIHDCIIELSSHNIQNLDTILDSLSELGCQCLELRSYETIDIDKIDLLLVKLQNTTIKNVEIYLKFSSELEFLSSSFVSKFPIIFLLYLHSAPEDKIINNIHHSKLKISDSSCCGVIRKDNFVVNLPFFLSGLSSNTCLSQKVAIDANGNIKNCPALNKSFGNTERKFVEIVNSTEFKELWGITKDQITTCKDCEFRYICSDCRAFVTSNIDKPFKCNYNPYTMSDDYST